MNIFISYRDSAGAAEIEFRKLFHKIGNGDLFRLPFIPVNTEGWSRMLPGLVCDLSHNNSDRKAPAIFMGMLGEQSMLSCVLQESTSFIKKPGMGRILREQDSLRRSSLHHRSDRLDLLTEIVDGTVSIQEITGGRGIPRDSGWSAPTLPFGFSDRTDPHLRLPNIHSLEDEAGEGEGLLDIRMADLLTLLDNASEESNSDDVVRKLVQDYHCRFAWASIQLDEPAPPSLTSLSYAPPVLGPPSLAPPSDKKEIRDLRSFWEKRALLMGPLGFSPYGSLVGRKRQIWPYWLQFLVLMSNAGRAKLRKYSFPRFLRFRRSDRFARMVDRDRASLGDATSIKTVSQVLRGTDQPLPAGPELRQRTMRLVRQKGLLLLIKKSLIVAGADTIYSLYRRDGSPQPAAIRKPRDRS